MDKTGGFGSMIGGVLGKVKKVPGAVKGAVKTYGPIAGVQAAIGAYGLKNQYDADLAAEAQQVAHPPRRALASIPGARNIVDMRRDLMPKLGGDKTMTSSLVTVLDQYLERERAFEWGVEQFCKQAGFDADDTKATMKLLKEAGRGGARLSPRAQTAKMFPQVPTRFLPAERPAQTQREMFGATVPDRVFGSKATAPAAPQAEALKALVGKSQSAQPKPVKPKLTGKVPTPGAAPVTSPEEFSKAIEPPPTDPIAAAAQAGKAPPAPKAVTKPSPASAAPEAKPADTTPGGATPVAPLEEAVRGEGKLITEQTKAKLQKAFETNSDRGARRSPGGGSRSAARFKARQAAAGGGAAAGTPPADTAAAAAAAGAGAEEAPQQQASGGPQPDGSWLPWAAALGGGYLAHGYGTEGGTYSMFDPPEVKAQKQKNRNDALGIKDPKATAAAPAAGGTPALANDIAARNRSMVENYKKQLELEGPDDPVTAARQLYGGVGQPSSMNNFNYFLGQDAGFQPWLEKTYGNERAQQIRTKLRGQTAGQPGA